MERNQSTDEFMRLFSGHAKSIYAYIYVLVSNHADAEDLFQETSRVLWQKFDQRAPRSDNAFHAWALRIAQIEVLSYRKRQRRRGEILTDDLYQLVSEATLAAAGSVNARLETLRDCCDKLPDDDQQLLRVRYETDASVAEIACRTGRSADSVYRSFRRIHEWLFECIEDVEQEEGLLSSQREQEQ